ncbi:RNA polymerase sigma factor [Catellatospora citrea]|uniref:RNA polymerase sigma factor n=1 Tax=Catellatospora citrea TaxID=53366 RepID=UPI000E7534A6|nr:sigma-70 family RNA polymerase sigma factor [Catellatospora citrea]RKE11496.1 RNA polymerase sigma-70 factor (ECF subfamily) [Catellatospora citrea]
MKETVDDFADFFRARRDLAYRTVFVAIGDRAGAEDAVAEAFARAYQHWASVRDHPHPTAWVIRTALNVSRSWWRRRRKEFLTAEGPEPGVTPTVDALDDALAAAVMTLSRRQREVVALRILADMDADETGRLLGITPATVHVHLHRALAALRGALGEQAAISMEGRR